MVNPIPPRVKQIWEHWNIRGVILLSLSLQVLLILFAPIRKRTGRKTIIFLIWSAYLLADAVANFAIGLIFNSQGNSSTDPSSPASKENSDLLAFWAPFLLVHLGGPDTITAFSLEDNQLWLRHLLSFGVQSVVTGYVFLQTLPSNKLIVPTSLLFLAGFIKYLERTCSLYLASKEKFRDSLLRKPEPGVDYAGLMDEYGSKIPDLPVTRRKSIRRTIGRVPSNQLAPKDLGLVLKAYRCFSLLKGLIVDLPIRATDYEVIHNVWRDMEGEDTFRMIEMELNFFYEVLYTKAVVVHSNLGKYCRSTTLVSVIAALFVFRFLVKKHGNFDAFDISVTYALLYGALTLDALALLMAFFSDWTVTWALQINVDKTCCPQSLTLFRSGMDSLFSKLLVMKKPNTNVDQRGLRVLVAPCVFRRWSGYVAGFNLIRFCLKRRPIRTHRVKHCSCVQLFLAGVKATVNFTRIDNVVICCSRIAGLAVKRAIRFAQVYKALPRLVGLWNNLVEWVGLRDLLNEMKYKSREPLTVELWEFILKELQTKSEQGNPETIIDARGERVLQSHFEDENCTELISYIVDVAFDESLLLWHIATELLYKEKKVYPEDRSYKDRYISKILSDYMVYLLIMRPTMMEAVSSSDQILRFQDTCAEAKRFFKFIGVRPTQVKTACKKILGLKMEITPKEVKGEEESMSVFFEANLLAKELLRLKERKWEVMSKVWVEMLSYAASHCSSRAHAQQISKGGELITFVWLVMAHYGLIKKQFQKKK